LVFFNLWPNWGATLYGEVRGATDYKRNFSGMAWALGVSNRAWHCLLPRRNKTIGWDFYMQANGAWWNYVWYGNSVPPLPVWPYPAMLAPSSRTALLQLIVMVLMSFWWFGWAGTLFLSSTRVIFAAAFDRLLPEKVAELSDRGTPVNAMLLMVSLLSSFPICMPTMWAASFPLPLPLHKRSRSCTSAQLLRPSSFHIRRRNSSRLHQLPR
jgi:APA family basic amino acid/polyamine antiporter